MDPPGLSASEATKEESFGEDDSDVADDSDEGAERDSKKPREASAEGATDGATTKEQQQQQQLRAKIKQGLQQLFKQLTDGCAFPGCTSDYCARSPGRLEKDAAAARALELIQQSVKLGGLEHTDFVCKPPRLTDKVLLAERASLISESKPWEKHVAARLYELFSTPGLLAESFLLPSGATTTSHADVNLETVNEFFTTLLESGLDDVTDSLTKAICDCMELLYSMTDAGRGRVLILAFEVPLIHDLEASETLLPKMCSAVVASIRVHEGQMAYLSTVWSSRPAAWLTQLVETLQQHITIRSLGKLDDEDYVLNDDEVIIAAVKMLEVLHQANTKMETPAVDADGFTNDAINDHMHTDGGWVHDFVRWKRHIFSQDPSHTIPERAISFCDYNFVLSLAVKVKVLQNETRFIRNHEERRGIRSLEELLGITRRPPFALSVTRGETLVRDAITQLSAIASEEVQTPSGIFRRELRVDFRGEEGLDYGGVRKEFFQLILKDLFNVNYGMFTYDEETRYYWFSRDSLEAPGEYRVLGMLSGVAVYNNVNLDLHFPPVVYKKLHRGSAYKGTLEDLALLNPGLAKGFRDLLAYPGDDVEEVFCRTFTVEAYEMFGMKQVVELCEGGGDKPLTNANREKFVELYVDYELNKSVKQCFDAFRDGFWEVCKASDAIKTLFAGSDLEELICGTQDLDFNALESIAKYDGFETGKDTPVIKWFWEIVHTFSVEDKKNLLAFSTGSDRVPVGGLERINFTLAKQGADAERLPSSHTCFNVLLLPEYSTKQKLEKYLRQAITHSEGFGMI